MNDKRTPNLKKIGSCTGFIALFLAILTILTLIYVPKWEKLDARFMRNFYAEEENTIDVLAIGSCNMYTSFLPTIAYEEYGITSCVFAGPDQEFVTAYHYLVDALKTQDVKVVALEALFLTCEPTAKREYYNRTNVEYMPASLNKAQLILELGAMESEYMKTVDPSAPNKLLTYAGYFFPLLRYHGREDVTAADITFHFNRDDSLSNHGASAYHNFLVNDSVDFPSIVNGTAIRETSREYFIKMRDLCEKEGIEFVLVKSPNNWRWDDERTALIRDFAAEQGVDFVDMHTYDDWLVSDYSQSTGRLNVFGMKKFTEHLCEYIQENYPYEPSVLSEAAKAQWEKDVVSLHATANKNEKTLDAGKIYQVVNTPTGISLTWNHADNASSYSVYRSDESATNFEKIATVTKCTFIDETAEPLTPYRYRIQPNDGSMAGIDSNERFFIFVEAPTAFTSECVDGAISLAWDAVEGADSYHLQRKGYTALNYESWDSTANTTYLNLKCTSGSHYSFRVRAVYKYNGDSFYSGGTIVSAMALPTPEIKSVDAESGSISVSWNKVKSAGGYEIYRLVEGEEEYTLCAAVGSSKTSYEDAGVTPGIQYSYKVVATKTSYDYTGRSSASAESSVFAN